MHLIAKLVNFELGRDLNKPIDAGKFLKKTRNKREILEYVENTDEVVVLPDSLAISIMDEFWIDHPKQLVTSS